MFKARPATYLAVAHEAADQMAEFADWLRQRGLSWPPNLWAGTSLTTNGSRPRISELRKVRATVQFLSVEPQIKEIDLAGRLKDIHWVIQGGESGKSKDPDKKA